MSGVLPMLVMIATAHISIAGAAVPTIPLTSGTRMPAIACGTGGDSNASATSLVATALAAGFTHIDTAHDYNDQGGVGDALARADRSAVFLTSKVPGCGVPTQGLMPPCYNNTLRLVDEDLALLQTDYVDLMLIHFPPLGGCLPSNCAHMQQQWAGLEAAYKAKKARAIGVSNYCKECLQCVMETATVTPMVNQVGGSCESPTGSNVLLAMSVQQLRCAMKLVDVCWCSMRCEQVQYHVGMGPEIPGGLLEYCVLHGIAVMAYSPLGKNMVTKEESGEHSIEVQRLRHSIY